MGGLWIKHGERVSCWCRNLSQASDLFKLMVACERMGRETLKVGVGRESCVFGALVMETPIYV
ncbi:hypothetical protein YC2023_102683 [Brassica napus]